MTRPETIEVVLFDVNETLLDMTALDPYFERVLEGVPLPRERWFEELKVLWHVTIATRDYQDFGKLAKAALSMLAEKEDVVLAAEDAAELLEAVTSLPPQPDAIPALELLAERGFRLAALTNGTSRGAKAQLEHAKLASHFERIFSADEVERFKPAPEPYQLAVRGLGVREAVVCLVAAHAWDIAGANAAGLQTGFVQRPRKVLSPLSTRPTFQAPDLIRLAEQLPMSS